MRVALSSRRTPRFSDANVVRQQIPQILAKYWYFSKPLVGGTFMMLLRERETLATAGGWGPRVRLRVQYTEYTPEELSQPLPRDTARRGLVYVQSLEMS